MATQMADIKSTNEGMYSSSYICTGLVLAMTFIMCAVLTSEVQDLRICLNSADKELKELKTEKNEERRSYESKVMVYLQKVWIISIMYVMSCQLYHMYMHVVSHVHACCITCMLYHMYVCMLYHML